MLTEKQLLANQRNARRSTGPRTPEGKAIASQNALRHGLRAEQLVIPGEDAAEFDQFRQLLIDDLAPAGALEVCLADRIVAAFWKLRRAGRIETDLLKELNRTAPQDEDKGKNKKGGTDLPFKIMLTKTYECPVHNKRIDQQPPPDGCQSCPVEADPENPKYALLPPPQTQIEPEQQEQQTVPSKTEDQVPQTGPESLSPPALGRIFRQDFSGSSILARFRLYEGQIERSLYKALTELQKIQLLRSKKWIDSEGVSQD